MFLNKRLLTYCALSFITLATVNAPAQVTTNCPASVLTATRANAGSNYDLLKLRAWAKHPTGTSSSLDTDLVLVVAHRGNWEFCPENTLESYEVAADLGADGDEMDLRISATGYDTSQGKNFPNGEAFLTHDYNLQGEAPGKPGDINNIYNASPDMVEGRAMVDRHGNPALDATGSVIGFHSLTDLLSNVFTRARLLNGGIQTFQTGYTQVVRGQMLVLDIKGDDASAYPNSSQVVALAEAMSEVKAFETANKTDLERMIVYKFGYNKVPYDTWTSLIANFYPNALSLPGVILIAYPENNTTFPSQITQFEDYPGYIMTNWNYRYVGISTEQWAIADLNAGKGNSGFSSNNSFPEGFRRSDGSCCSDQPFNTYSLSSYDFLFQPANPSFPRVRATLQTVDTYQNTVDYLRAIGLRTISHIQ
jgi:hypothetical protein